MSVQSVKNKMVSVQSRLQTTTNEINNIITLLNNVGDENINSIFKPIEKFGTTLNITKNEVMVLYNMTSVELHIFFDKYNRQLKESVEGFEVIKEELSEVWFLGMLLYELYLIHVEYMHYAISVLSINFNDLKKPIPRLNELKKTLEVLKMDTTTNNNKLIVKQRG